MRSIYRAYWLIFLFLLVHPNLFAQQNNNWIFGDHAGINFNSGSAVAFYNPVINILEGCAVASDVNGNVLFYTDGYKVWNRNDQVMSNGTGLGGGSSSTSVLILQKPGDCSKYYIFTTQDHTQIGDLYYSEVDMCLNSGYGDVVVGEKKIFLHTNMSEKLCVVPNTNGTDAWLITHQLSSNTYDVYSITSAGINTVASTYSIGSSFSYDSQSGYLKSSPSGTKLAVGVFWTNICEVVNFDPSSGVVSGTATNYGPSMTSTSNGLWYGFEFSPNEQYLYATRAGFGGDSAYLYQIDLTSGNITLLSSAIQPVDYYYGALRQGPDGKIYMARSSTNYLGVINYPDSAGLACNYVDLGFQLNTNSTCEFGLPLAMVTMPFNNLNISLGNDTTACNPFTIHLQPTCDMTFVWQDGSSDSSYTISSPGTYWVTATNQCGIASDTINVFAGIQGSISGDTIICKGQMTTLSAPVADSYLWNTGSSSQTVTVSPDQTTQYSVTITSGTCTDTINVTVEVVSPTKTSLYLPDDTICLKNPPFQLSGGVPSGGAYSGTGVSNNYFYPLTAGTGTDTIYYVYTDLAGCTDTSFDEFVVEVCSGLSEINHGNITISPTFTSDQVTITNKSNEDYDEIILLNALGKIVYQLPVSLGETDTYTISLNGLSSGIYYLMVYGKETIMAKIFKN